MTKGPVSYSALEGSGHLERTTDGLTALRESQAVGGVNDRELGSFPPYGKGGHATALRAQELLIEFGPLMVKKKMLAP